MCVEMFQPYDARIHRVTVRDSIVVSISACHADDPGSIPGRGVFSSRGYPIMDITAGGAPPLSVAVIAQLGERQTEDLEVLGSIPSPGIIRCTRHSVVHCSAKEGQMACGLMV